MASPCGRPPSPRPPRPRRPPELQLTRRRPISRQVPLRPQPARPRPPSRGLTPSGRPPCQSATEGGRAASRALGCLVRCLGALRRGTVLALRTDEQCRGDPSNVLVPRPATDGGTEARLWWVFVVGQTSPPTAVRAAAYGRSVPAPRPPLGPPAAGGWSVHRHATSVRPGN